LQSRTPPPSPSFPEFLLLLQTQPDMPYQRQLQPHPQALQWMHLFVLQTQAKMPDEMQSQLQQQPLPQPTTADHLLLFFFHEN
jgi:hypothetical protein